MYSVLINITSKYFNNFLANVRELMGGKINLKEWLRCFLNSETELL